MFILFKQHLFISLFLEIGIDNHKLWTFREIDKKESRTINCCARVQKRGYLLLFTSCTRESVVNNDTRSA